MKNLLLLLLVFFFCAHCSDSGTDPQPKPPGYQEDIPWPSLADSPWPMYRADPQNTGRTNYPGPKFGEIKWTLSNIGLRSGAIVGEDSSIYFCAVYEDSNGNPESGLFSVSNDGNINWIFDLNIGENAANPLIDNNGIIYAFSPGEGRLYAITEKGEQKWNLSNLEIGTGTCINIGLDGTLYFIENNSTLTSVDYNGQIKWKLNNLKTEGSQFRTMAFSPDGKSLYLPGAFGKTAVVSIDIFSQTVKWEFGGPSMGLAPIMVDSKGRIYVINIDENKTVKLFSLNENGKPEWGYKLHENIYATAFQTIAMDKYGTVYTGHYTLIAINYNGEELWKKSFEGCCLNAPMVIDIDNIIYYDRSITEFSLEINAIEPDGNNIWKLQYPKFARSAYSMAIGYSEMLLYPTWRSLFFSSIK